MASRLPKVVPNESGEWFKRSIRGIAGGIPGYVNDVDVYHLREWLRDCEKYDIHCKPITEEGRGIPLFLIDIEQRCLVEFKLDMQFIALSYVWGTGAAAGTKTAKNILESLLRPGSLLSGEAVITMPKTVADAMILTGLLGKRYLWCDRLCIAQDDPESQHDQIAQMSEIYARAYCTIIAFDSEHSDSGLNGLPMLSGSNRRTRWLPQPDIKFPWLTRGWTFQEEKFSTRKIKMASDAIRWSCGPDDIPSGRGMEYDSHDPKLRYAHDVDPRVSKPSGPLGIDMWPSCGLINTGGLAHPKFPHFDWYCRFIDGYTNRAFTKPEDVLSAFVGVANALTVSFPGGFIQGLPAILFSEALLWQYHSVPFLRRTCSDPEAAQKPASWSWIGWKGNIWWPQQQHYDVFPIKSPFTASSIVDWSVSTNLDGPKTPIDEDPAIAEFLRWQDIAEDDDDLPPGWSRYVWEEYGGLASYKHKEFWRTHLKTFSRKLFHSEVDQPILFEFPFPTDNDVQKLRPTCPAVFASANYLHGRVPCCPFKFTGINEVLEYTNTKRPRTVIATIASLRTDRIVGIMVCQPFGKYAPGAKGDMLQVIAISEGRMILEKDITQGRMSSMDEFFVPELTKAKRGMASKTFESLTLDGAEFLPGDEYCFYNVLWIEPGRPAYRKGLGRIEYEAFNKDYSPENDIDIILG